MGASRSRNPLSLQVSFGAAGGDQVQTELEAVNWCSSAAFGEPFDSGDGAQENPGCDGEPGAEQQPFQRNASPGIINAGDQGILLCVGTSSSSGFVGH